MKKGEKLEFLIQEKFPYMSNRRFAEMADIPPTTLQGIFKRGIETAAIQTVKKIAKTLEMSVDDLINYLIKPDFDFIEETTNGPVYIEVKSNSMVKPKINEKIASYYKAAKNHNTISINYYGDVSAGIPQSVEGIENAEKIELPKVLLGKNSKRDDVFAVKVNGESMNKIIPNGSIAICIPVNGDDEVKNEDIVIFTKDSETSMKRFYSTEDAIIFSPESTMRCFYDVVINKESLVDVKINAKVISYHAFLD